MPLEPFVPIIGSFKAGGLALPRWARPKSSSWYSGPTTQLWWRYQRPTMAPPDFTTYNATVAEIVSSCRLVITSGSDNYIYVPSAWGYGDTTSWKEAYVMEGYNGLWLQYIDPMFASYPVQGMNDGSACSSGDAFTTMPAYLDTDYCALLHGTHANFVHNGGGDRLYDTGSPSRYCMNPDPAGPYNDFVCSRLNPASAENTFDAWGSAYGTPNAEMVMLDDIWMTRHQMIDSGGYFYPPDGNADGSVQEYADDAAWYAACLAFVENIQAAAGSIPLSINTDDPSQASDHYAGKVNGGFQCEFFVTGWGGGAGEMAQSDIEAWMDATDVALANGKIAKLLSWPHWDRDPPYTAFMQGYRMAQAGFLMVAHPKAYWRFADDGFLYPPDVGQGTAFLPEMLWDIGEPLGPRSKPTFSDVMERTFRAGKAVLNMGANTYTNYALGSSYYLPDGSGPVTQVTLDPYSGLMLRTSL